MGNHSSSFRNGHTPLAQRRQWVAQYQRSGLSAEAFAKTHGLNVWTLRGWVVQIKAERPSTGAEPPAVQEVKLGLPEILTRPPAPQWKMEVQWASGTSVRLAAGVEAREAELLLRAIRDLC